MSNISTKDKKTISVEIDFNTLKEVDEIAKNENSSREKIIKESLTEYVDYNDSERRKKLKNTAKHIELWFGSLKKYANIVIALVTLLVILCEFVPLADQLFNLSIYNTKQPNTFVILYKFLPLADNLFGISICNTEHPNVQDLFRIIGFALALSTAIELLYMLITDGPDEATDPIITGIASTILIVLSNVGIDDFGSGFNDTIQILHVSIIILCLVLSITLLFVVRHLFFNSDK